MKKSIALLSMMMLLAFQSVSPVWASQTEVAEEPVQAESEAPPSEEATEVVFDERNTEIAESMGTMEQDVSETDDVSQLKEDGGETIQAGEKDDGESMSSSSQIQSEERVDAITITSFEALGNDVLYQHLPVGSDEGSIVFPTELLVRTADSGVEKEIVLSDIQWELKEGSSLEKFDGNSDGSEYYYTPVIHEMYALESGVELPKITVLVGEYKEKIPLRMLKASAAGRNERGFIAPIDDAELGAVEISDAQGLANIAKDPYGTYVLTADIDLSDYGSWTPIGNSLDGAFQGKLDGQGHTISGLNVTYSFDSAAPFSSPAVFAAGLFGVCKGAEIKNIYFDAADISITTKSGYSYDNALTSDQAVYAGIIAAYAYDSTVIYNCHTAGSVLAKAYEEAASPAIAGSLIGHGDTVLISYCYNEASVDAYNGNALSAYDGYAGGLAGRLYGGVIDKSYNVGTVTSRTLDYGIAYAGGLIGYGLGVESTITDSFNEGTVIASAGNMFCDKAYAGGIAAAYNGEITRVYDSGAVQAQIKDPYGIANASAYSGGISALATNETSINNSAIVQSNVASTGTGSKYSYRIAQNGIKNNNATCSTISSGTTNDANNTFADSEFTSQGIYESTLGWNFSTTWEFVDGKSFPQLRQVDTTSEAYNEEYVQQHLDFINSGRYADFVENDRWAQIYWSDANTLASNTGEMLYKVTDAAVSILELKFTDAIKKLIIFDNPFDAIVADFVSSQTVKESILQFERLEFDDEKEIIYKQAESFIKRNWKSEEWDALSNEDLYWLFHYDERPSEQWIDDNFEEHIYEIVYGTRNSESTLEKIWGLPTAAVDTILEIKDSVNGVIGWFNKSLDRAAEIKAYKSSCEEFQILMKRMLDNIDVSDSPKPLYEKLLKESLKNYTKLSDRSISQEMIIEFIANGTVDNVVVPAGKAAEKFVNKTISGWIEEAVPADVLASWQVVAMASEGTWKLMDYITSNGKIQDCREVLRANSFFEDVLYHTIDGIKTDFVNDQSFENARLFDVAFKALKKAEVTAVDACINYMATYQSAWSTAIRYGSRTYLNSSIKEAQMNKIRISKTYCHGSTYELGGKIITIACPTDVVIYDESGAEAAVIKENKVVSCDENIEAFTADSIKIITVPADQIYSVGITASESGEMSYSVSEYRQDGSFVQTAAFNNIPITKGQTFSGTVNEDLETPIDNYRLSTDGNPVGVPAESYNEETNVPVETLQIVNGLETMTAGDEIRLEAQVMPENASVRTVAWESSDESIVYIDDTGVLKARGSGAATVTAKSIYGGVSHSIDVIVLEEGKTIYITQDPSDADYFIGDEADSLSVNYYAAEGDEVCIEWFVSEDEDLTNPVKLDSAEKTVKPDTAHEGIYYYYAVLTRGDEKIQSETAVISVKAIPPLAEGDIGDVHWAISSDYTLTVTGDGSIPDYDTTNKAPWNEYADRIVKAVISDSVVGIGSNAFAGFTSLREIVVPFIGKSIDSSNEEAVLGYFFGTSDDGNVTQYHSLNGTSLSGYKYMIPETLKKITVTNAEKISFGAFDNCNMLEEIILNAGIASIEGYSFANCTGIKELIVPDSVESIGENSLSGCNALEKITIPFIGSSADADNTEDAVFGIIFGRSSSGIVQYFSLNNGSLSGYYYDVPQSLKTVVVTNEEVIPVGAFSGCENIEKVYLNKDITDISLYAFYNCSGLKDVYYADTQISWNKINTDMSGNDVLNSATIHYTPSIEIAGHSLSLKGDIGINYFFYLSEEVINDAGAKVVFTMPNGAIQEVYVKDAGSRTINNKDAFMFTCAVNSTQMTGEVNAKVVLSDGTESESYPYTVKTYADYILANAEAVPAYGKAAGLMKTMLNYGGYAQGYFKYDNAPFANEDLDETDKDVSHVTEDVLTSYQSVVEGDEAGINYVGSSLILKSETSIRHYFTLDDGCSIKDYAFSCGNNILQPQTQGKYYYVEIPNIASGDLDTQYKVNVGGLTIKYSALSYANTILRSDSQGQELKNLLKAVYLYNQAANEYFGK